MTDATPAPVFNSPTYTDENPKPEIPKTKIFELNGREFFIENRERPNLSFGYLRRLRTEGQAPAEAWMNEQVLGLEALEALENYDEMTNAEREALNARVSEVTMGKG